MTSLFGFSQEQRDSMANNYVSEHVKFMGIAMEGPLEEFKDKLIAKGLKFYMVNEKNVTILTGLFAGTKLSSYCNQIGIMRFLEYK